MADNSELAELQRKVPQLEREMERLEKAKLSRPNPLQRIVFVLFFPLVVLMLSQHWSDRLGWTTPRGDFSSVTVNHDIRAERLSLDDHSRIDVETSGEITSDPPTIRLSSSEDREVEIDSNHLELRGARGTIILELNEKGEPVLRSIPKVEKK